MVRDTVRTLWAEPRAAHPPLRVWRDWALVAVLVPTALVEGVLRDDVVWRPLSILLGVALPWTLLWRRTHPLAAVVVAFGAIILADIASVVGDANGVVGLYTTIFILLFPYSLVRWGSGREIGIGLVLIQATAILGIAIDYTGVVDSVVGFLFLLFPATLGATVRYWTSSRLRELDQVKLRERAELARELHDTVAHHVSAIAIRAQAGRVVAATHPEAALEALDVIDEEASLTLAELRVMVGGLRDGAAASLTPQPGVADLERLARGVGNGPAVVVDLSGDLDDLRPSVGSAVYRIAQESVTNAVRHARHATHILVRVVGDEDSVRVTVSDDGQAGSTANGLPGYGLLGMTERAALLGGSLQAGPGPERGWTVDAVLPQVGRSRMTVRVLVADDQALVRTGLSMILDAQADIEVVGQAADGLEAVALARRLRPDVCLFDIRMPGLDGIEATRELAGPGIADPLAIVVITTFDLDEYVHGLLKAGARGFLLKDAGPDSSSRPSMRRPPGMP